MSSLWHTNNRLRGTHWGLSPNSVRAKKLNWLGVWNRTLRNRIRPVSDKSTSSRPVIDHSPSTAGTFPWKFRKNSGKTPATLWELFLKSPREYGWDPPSPIIQRIWRLQSISRIISPPSTAGDASFFRSGSGEGLSEPVMEFPAVLVVFLSESVCPNLGGASSSCILHLCLHFHVTSGRSTLGPRGRLQGTEPTPWTPSFVSALGVYHYTQKDDQISLDIFDTPVNVTPYMRETGTMWQIGVLTGKPCTFLVQAGSFLAFWHHKKWRVSRGLDVKWHIPSTCHDASRKWFSTGICNINRASQWLWQKPKEPLTMAKICTVSRLERQFATLYLFHAPTRDPPTRNLTNFKFFRNPLKILNVYFRGDNVYFRGNTVYFGEIMSTLGVLEDFRVLGISFVVPGGGGGWGSVGRGSLGLFEQR